MPHPLEVDYMITAHVCFWMAGAFKAAAFAALATDSCRWGTTQSTCLEYRGAETSHDSLSISQKDKVLWARARGSSSATSLLGARLGRPRHTSDPKHTVRQQSKTSALDAQPVGQGQLSVLCSSFSMKAGDMARAVNFLLAKDSTVARSIR